MAKQNIVWEKLPKTYALFTKRNTVMVDLDKGEVVQHYSSNVKINIVEQAMFIGERYFRTASAAEKGLNWAFKANSFALPADDAPLAHSTFLTHTKNSNRCENAFETFSPEKQKYSQKPIVSKNGERPRQQGHTKKGIMKRLFSRFKR